MLATEHRTPHEEIFIMHKPNDFFFNINETRDSDGLNVTFGGKLEGIHIILQ